MIGHGRGGRERENHPVCVTRATHERAPMHMLNIPMDSLPYGGRGQRRSGRLLPPSDSVLLPFARRLSSFLASSGSPSKHTMRISPLLVRTTSTACVGTHMSRIPTVFPFARVKMKRSRRRRGREAVTLREMPRERTKDARLQHYTRTRTCVRQRRTDRHVHSRARPFAALSRDPAFQNCPRDGSTDKCSFFVRDTRVSGLGIPRRGMASMRNATGFISAQPCGMLMRKFRLIACLVPP